MVFVRVEHGKAHLASAVRLVSVQGRDGQPVCKATLTAISNTRKGSGDKRGEEGFVDGFFSTEHAAAPEGR